MTAEINRTETVRARAERELAEDLQMRVVCDRGETNRYQLQHITGGTVTAVRPVERSMFTLWTETVRGRVALLERWMKETGGK